MPATPSWLAAVEAMLNRGIEDSAAAAELTRRLRSSTLCVEVKGLTSVRASIAGGRLALIAIDEVPAARADHAADAVIRGSPAALLRLAGASGPGVPQSVSRAGRDRSGGASLGEAASISGDAEIANSFRQLFLLARPDLEEELSRWLGDLPARRLSQFARSAIAWGRRTRRTAFENVAEFLQEESRDVVNRPELDEFLQAVDALRETVDRAEARLTVLERRMHRPA